MRVGKTRYQNRLNRRCRGPSCALSLHLTPPAKPHHKGVSARLPALTLHLHLIHHRRSEVRRASLNWLAYLMNRSTREIRSVTRFLTLHHLQHTRKCRGCGDRGSKYHSARRGRRDCVAGVHLWRICGRDEQYCRSFLRLRLFPGPGSGHRRSVLGPSPEPGALAQD